MAGGQSTSPAPSASSSLRSTSQRHTSQPSSPRLATITEGALANPIPPVPRRSSKRNSGTGSTLLPGPGRWSGSQTTGDTSRTAPPAYNWVPEPLDGAKDDNAPVEGEKLAELRKNKAFRSPRGGWGRLSLIAGLILLVVIALAVGLGVGLTVNHGKKESTGQTTTTPPGAELPPQKLPLGQYSFVTALTTVETACTSNAATWRCYPFVVFDPSDPTTTNTSITPFNWVINNTESTYATVHTADSVGDLKIPANLTVSSITNPFGISFGPKSLTYVASSTNSTSPHYTFTFTMDKKVVPSPAITSNNHAAVCFFNQTQFTGNIYLSAPRNYPTGTLANSSGVGGYEQWPYAVEILQTASGGDNVPNCYETIDSVVGTPITNLTPQDESAECLCEYRNYY